jgi:hypothetical protein
MKIGIDSVSFALTMALTMALTLTLDPDGRPR